MTLKDGYLYEGLEYPRWALERWRRWPRVLTLRENPTRRAEGKAKGGPRDPGLELVLRPSSSGIRMRQTDFYRFKGSTYLSLTRSDEPHDEATPSTLCLATPKLSPTAPFRVYAPRRTPGLQS